MKNSYYVFGVSSIYQQAWKSYKPYLLVCVFEKQITLPSEDTVIFIGQKKWAQCLLFFRRSHSCSMEFCWDLGCYHGLGLTPCRAAIPMPREQMGPLSVTLAYLLLTCHNNLNIFWLVPATLDYTFGQIWMVNPWVPLLWQKTVDPFSAISQRLLPDIWLPVVSFQEVNKLVGST